jgi:GTPase SAR1 family protein
MKVAYKTIEFSLYEYLVRIEDRLTLLEADEETLSKINKDKELLRTKQYSLAVMGEFKRGKSSLINALMGHKILPAGVEPTTATINRITYGPELKALVHFKDGTKREVDINKLAEYVTKLTPDGASRAAQIEEAVVYAPVVICQNHVDIIDTPGLNDEESMTKISTDILNSVDAVLFTIQAKSPFSGTEKNFVCQLIKSNNINNVIFVVTFMDQLDDDEYDYDNYMASIKSRIYNEVIETLTKDNSSKETIDKANALLKDLHIYGISSKLALDSFISNDKNALKKSRFDLFKSALMQDITAKQVENTFQKIVRDIKEILSGLDLQYNTKMKSFADAMSEASAHNQCISDFCDETEEKLSSLFLAREQDIAEIIASLNQQKNSLTQGFIKELSKVRINEHGVISDAIISASLGQNKMMNETILPVVKNKLLICLEQIIAQFETDRINTLIIPFNALNVIAKIDFGKEAHNRYIFLDEKIKNISFKWVKTTIPNVADLSQCDIINHIIDVIDDSISKLIHDINDFIESSKMFVFQCINTDTETIKNMSKKAEEEKRHGIDIKSKAVAGNFALFSDAAKDIIKNSEAILEGVIEQK